MLKIGKKYLLLALTFLLVLQLPIQAGAKEINDDPFIINGTAKITNLETGEVKEVKLTDIKELSAFNIDGNNYDKTVETIFKIPIIGTDSEESVEKSNDVRAKLTINYDYDVVNDKIRINSFSGFWIPSNDFVLVDNRKAGCHDGRPFPIGDSITQYPTSNTFNYSTGWGYVTYYPVNPPTSGPRAYSEARVIIPGMGSGHIVVLELYINK